MEIKLVHNERDHQQALRRVEGLWDCGEGSAEYGELGGLATLIEGYEREHYPCGAIATRWKFDETAE